METKRDEKGRKAEGIKDTDGDKKEYVQRKKKQLAMKSLQLMSEVSFYLFICTEENRCSLGPELCVFWPEAFVFQQQMLTQNLNSSNIFIIDALINHTVI